jgi:hypothetical protein
MQQVENTEQLDFEQGRRKGHRRKCSSIGLKLNTLISKKVNSKSSKQLQGTNKVSLQKNVLIRLIANWTSNFSS